MEILEAPKPKEWGRGRPLHPNAFPDPTVVQGSGVVPDTYPILAVTVAGADDGPRLLDHLQDSSSVDVAGHIGIIRPHDPR